LINGLKLKPISTIFGPRVYLHRDRNFDSSSATKQLTPTNIKATIEFSYTRNRYKVMPMKTELTWWERLLQLVCLLSIKDAEGVQVLGAAHLELDNILAPLDLHGTGILPPCSEEEVLDLVDLLRLQRHK
jgi:hypothetical protein